MTDTRYNAFESWLKANGYVTAPSYLGYMRRIEETLGIKDFHTIRSISLLEKYLAEIQTKRQFISKSESDQSNIRSGFGAYIEFIKETKSR